MTFRNFMLGVLLVLLPGTFYTLPSVLADTSANSTINSGAAGLKESTTEKGQSNLDKGDTNGQGSLKGAAQVVDGLHRLLIESMKLGDKSSCGQRFELLSGYIKKHFDFPTISRIILGRRHWKEMTEEQRQAFIDTFTKMTVATYADRFNSYSGEKFKIVKERPFRKGYYIVDAKLIKGDGDQVDFEYLCKRVGNGWKIVSVSAKGVNNLSVRRADYNSYLKDHTIDQLIERLKAKVNKCLIGHE